MQNKKRDFSENMFIFKRFRRKNAIFSIKNRFFDLDLESLQIFKSRAE